VVTVRPLKCLINHDLWELDFKSVRIAREVVELMLSKEDGYLRDIYSLLHTSPAGSRLAGRIFEAIVHRALSGGSTLQHTTMVSDRLSPPTFSTLCTSPPSPAAPYEGPRAVMRADFTHGLDDVTLEADRYYIPTSATHPLFDSFTVHIDSNQQTAIISIFQITISPTHTGSAGGYSLIHRIMAHVRKLLRYSGSDAGIKVAY